MKNKLVELESLCKMSQSAVKRYVTEELLNSGYKPEVRDGFVYAKGKHPVLLVAHMDTVHKEVVKKINRKGSIIYSPQGIGGDDRCGVFIILKLIEFFNCSVLFCEDEEIGCVGAKKFLDSIDYTSLDINFIIEFDRRGSNDCVFYDCDNNEFEDFILSTGFWKTHWGSCSDISYLAPTIGCAAVNLSCGYHNEHTLDEYIDTEQVLTVIEEAKKLLSLKSSFYEYVERETLYDFYGRRFCDDIDGYDGFPYHLYVKIENKPLIAYEVFAYSEMEAIGIFLSENPTLTAGNILHIYSYY